MVGRAAGLPAPPGVLSARYQTLCWAGGAVRDVGGLARVPGRRRKEMRTPLCNPQPVTLWVTPRCHGLVSSGHSGLQRLLWASPPPFARPRSTLPRAALSRGGGRQKRKYSCPTPHRGGSQEHLSHAAPRGPRGVQHCHPPWRPPQPSAMEEALEHLPFPARLLPRWCSLGSSNNTAPGLRV